MLLLTQGSPTREVNAVNEVVADVHSRDNVSPMLSLPLQEEKWSAVLPLSSAAQGSMLSCRSVRTDGAHHD